jgi:lipoate-protein ligase A
MTCRKHAGGQTRSRDAGGRTRAPAVLLSGSAPEIVAGIEGDFALLSASRADVRVWSSAQAAVVLGASRDVAAEVDEAACKRLGVAVVRRASGGGTVFVGPGTLQYAIAVPHPAGAEPPSLTQFRRISNEAVLAALAGAAVAMQLRQDDCGDLRAGDRKVAGFAMRRIRQATMLHGTLLVQVDLDVVASVLRHPAREPDWRRGRSHAEFIANLGPVDASAFEAKLREYAMRFASPGTPPDPSLAPCP